MKGGMYFEIYQNNKGRIPVQWRWRLKAKNHEIIAMSSQAYKDKRTCRRCIDLVREAFAPDVITIDLVMVKATKKK